MDSSSGEECSTSGSLDAADKVCDKCLVTETQTDKTLYQNVQFSN
jgi:hypothetical protein